MSDLSIYPVISIVFAVTVVFMLALRPLAIGAGLIDRPGGRKRHVGEIPVIGGIAMFAGVAVGVILMPRLTEISGLLLLAGSLLVVVGAIDDRFHLPASVRLIAQLAAILIMAFGAGLMIRDLGDPLWLGTIRLGPLSLFGTVLIFATVINAYNLIDGLDGLGGGMALIAAVAAVLVAGPSSGVGALALIIAAAITAYLIFNFPYGNKRPFRAFMGDAGSTFLGICVVWLTVSLCQGPDRLISPVQGLFFAAIPVWDLLTCFVRRVRKRQSPFDSGRDHFHHILLESGMSAHRSAMVLLCLQTGYAAFGVASAPLGLSEPMIFTIWAVLGLTQLMIIRSIGDAYRRSVQRVARS